MAYLKLIREHPDGLAVRGTLYLATYEPASLATDTETALQLDSRGSSASPQKNRTAGFSGGPEWREEEVLTKLCNTLENRSYLIPPLIYRLTVTYSPKFKRPLPLVNSVPRTPPAPLGGEEYRTGIRFHPGTKPEHSRGCILVSRADENMLRELILGEREVRMEVNEEPRIYADNNE